MVQLIFLSLCGLGLLTGCADLPTQESPTYEPIHIQTNEQNSQDSGQPPLIDDLNQKTDGGSPLPFSEPFQDQDSGALLDENTDSEPVDLCAEVICGDNAGCNSHDGSCFCLDGFHGDPYAGCNTIEQEESVGGWIGDSCAGISDCDYEDAACLTESDGYPDGMCTQSCELYCPDRDGEPVTFCITPPDTTDGQCVSRCDFQLYPNTGGCRADYACVQWARHNESATQHLVCVPEGWANDSDCADPTNIIGDDACYLEMVSYGDDALETYGRSLLAGTADAEEALAFLDSNYEHSVTFVEVDLNRTIHNNYSSGHYSAYPMRGMIVHYTASQKEDGTIKYFVSSSPHASTHFVVGSYRNGLIVQIFSHENRTWHAGSDYNYDRFGFDFANAGYLDPDGSGWQDYADRDYYMNLPLHGNEPIEVTDGIPGAHSKYANKEYWQPYTYYQLLSYVMVGRALHLVYDLEEEAIERHGDVSNSRVDPGPHFPFKHLNELIFNTEDVFEKQWLGEYKVQPDWIADHPEAR